MPARCFSDVCLEESRKCIEWVPRRRENLSLKYFLCPFVQVPYYPFEFARTGTLFYRLDRVQNGCTFDLDYHGHSLWTASTYSLYPTMTWTTPVSLSFSSGEKHSRVTVLDPHYPNSLVTRGNCFIRSTY